MADFFEAIQGLKTLCGYRYADHFYVNEDASEEALSLKFSAIVRMIPYGFLLSAYRLNIFSSVKVIELVKQVMLQRSEFERTVETEILNGFEKKLLDFQTAKTERLLLIAALKAERNIPTTVNTSNAGELEENVTLASNEIIQDRNTEQSVANTADVQALDGYTEAATGEVLLSSSKGGEQQNHSRKRSINIKSDVLLGTDVHIPVKKLKPTVPGHGPGECICVILSSDEEDSPDTSGMSSLQQQQQQQQESTPTLALGDTDMPASQFEEGQRFEISEPILQYEVAFDADNELFIRYPNTDAFNTQEAENYLKNISQREP